MTDNAKFRADITKFVEKSKLSLEKAVRYIALDLFRRTVMRTPVDTGLLRGNWQLAVGAAPAGTLPVRTGEQAISDAMSAAQGSKLGQDIWMMNNLPYAVVIEYGGYPDPVKKGTYVPAGKTRYGVAGPGYVQRSAGGYSRQAPQGVVRISLQETLEQIEATVASIQ